MIDHENSKEFPEQKSSVNEELSNSSEPADESPESKERSNIAASNRRVYPPLTFKLLQKEDESSDKESSETEKPTQEPLDDDDVVMSSSNFYSSILMTIIFIVLCGLQYPKRIHYEMQNTITNTYNEAYKFFFNFIGNMMSMIEGIKTLLM